ncbi:MAG TPA: hypothetical protein VLX68_04585 [Chitinivibrionales bacterium]|nr:hypothetical protein [Chitinivibrionales bacterium]
MASLFKNKIFLIIVACAVAYFFFNPGGKFGFAQKNLVIYNRVPLMFYDLYVGPNGSPKPVEEISGKETLQDIWNDLFSIPPEENILIIIGSGFSRPTFVLNDETVIAIEAKGATIKQLPSPQAIKLFNASVDQHKKVAILLRLRD